MSRSICWLAALAMAWMIIAPPSASAQVTPPETYAGDLWSRPRLTGDWGGFRDTLAKRGVVLDVDFLQTLQGVASGGRDTGVEWSGRFDYTLNLDTGKLGLWPGGFLRAHGETTLGDSVNGISGAVGAPNPAALFPVPGQETTTLTNLSFAQFLSPKFGLIAGKIETYGGDQNAFAHGFHDNFLNLGFSFNLVNALVPISALGGGIVVLPWEGALFSALVLDPNGKPEDVGFDHAFEGGVLVVAEGRVAVKPFGLLGHQLVGFSWSDKERVSLDQDPSNIFRGLLTSRFPRLQDPGPVLRRILERFFPELLVPVQPLRREQETWSVFYNFDQYLWSPAGDPERGIGPFFRFGVSDGKANPIKYHYNVGIGGKGIVPGRPRDTFGIGWSRLEFSDSFVPFLRQRLNLGLDREDSVEMYYNASITKWLNVTVDLQVIEPGLKKTLGASGRLENVDTTVVGGLRVYARF